MIVEHSVRRAEDSLAIPSRIDGNPYAWLHIVLVGLNPLLQSEQVIGGQSKPLRRLELRRDLHVVTQPVVQSDLGVYSPRILPEKSQRNVVERIGRAAETLNV